MLFAALLFRVGYLQLFERERYARLSEDNRVRVKEVDPVRGMIFDRMGRILVENRPGYSVVTAPQTLLEHPAVLKRLRELLGEGDEDAWLSAAKKYLGRRPEIRLKRDLKFEQLARLEAKMLFLPGLELKVEAKRYYPYKAAPHILGYLGEISSDELETYVGLHPGDIVGKKGVEKSCNALMFGKRGYNVIEVDAAGNKIRDIPGIRNIPPTKGSDVYLTIDLELQQLAEELLSGGQGAIVAIDPNNGDILTIASNPGYDSETFSGVVSPENWEALVSDPCKPLLNRAIQGTYPPGSTIKMTVLAAALEEGVINMDSKIVCQGFLQIGRRPFKCWSEGGHGKIGPYEAIERSCDVFCYHMGLELGIERMAEYYRAFGFANPTGIDIEGEVSGLVPDSAYMNSRYGEKQWTRGHLLNIAIGQGDLLVTPLQLAVYCAAIANRGLVPTPHLHKGTVHRHPDYWESHQPKFRKIEAVSPENFEFIREGMYRVVQAKRGTAHWLMDPNIAVAGKTGTAQNPHGEDHAWFIGFAPYDQPAIAVCALVEHGEHGSTAAAPIVFKIIKRYLQIEKQKETSGAGVVVG